MSSKPFTLRVPQKIFEKMRKIKRANGIPLTQQLLRSFKKVYGEAEEK